MNRQRRRAETVVEACEEHHPRAFRQIYHFSAFCLAHAEGLFAEDVLSVAAGGADVGEMAWGRGGYADGVDAAFEEGLLVREAQGDSVLFLHLPEALRIRFEDGVEFKAVRRLEDGDVAIVRDCPASHETYLFHLLCSLFIL